MEDLRGTAEDFVADKTKKSDRGVMSNGQSDIGGDFEYADNSLEVINPLTMRTFEHVARGQRISHGGSIIYNEDVNSPEYERLHGERKYHEKKTVDTTANRVQTLEQENARLREANASAAERMDRLEAMVTALTTTDNSYAALQQKAKALGINSKGMKREELIDAIEAHG